MKHVVWALILGVTAWGFAQEPSVPPSAPPEATPPTFPPQQGSPEEMPPDEKPPADQSSTPSDELSTPEVQQQIQDGLNSEPMLKNTNVGVKTDDSTVTLTGTVSSDEQHELALRIAESYAGNRKVVDRITVASQA